MRPVYDMLKAAAGRRSFHMPGHKGKSPFGVSDLFALDTTELPLTDDLYSPENGLKEAQAFVHGLGGRVQADQTVAQQPCAVSDEGFDGLLGIGGAAHLLKRAVAAGGQIGQGIEQGSVQIKDDGLDVVHGGIIPFG